MLESIDSSALPSVIMLIGTARSGTQASVDAVFGLSSRWCNRQRLDKKGVASVTGIERLGRRGADAMIDDNK